MSKGGLWAQAALLATLTLDDPRVQDAMEACAAHGPGLVLGE